MAETQDTLPFRKVESPHELQTLVAILETRLPQSGNIFNMVLKHKQLEDYLTVYKFNEDEGIPSAIINASTWIMCIYIRQDYGKDITLSPPPNAESTAKLRSAFMSSKLFNWNQPYCFSCIPSSISSMFVEISCLKGNPVSVHPCFMYYFPSNVTMTLDQFTPRLDSDETLELKSLNTPEGIQFMYETWPHSKEGSREYISKVLSELESVGLSISGKLVSGILTSGNGLMGMLFTLQEFRNRKFGHACMKELIRKLRAKGLVPCSVVEAKNKASNRFHESIGMQVSHRVDVIIYEGSKL